MPDSISSSRLALAWVLARGCHARRAARLALAAGDEAPADVRAALRDRVPGVIETLDAGGWRFVAADDDEFPGTLELASDPPVGLFIRGALPPGPGVAVVGARRATAYGREVAEYLGRELAAAGAVVISGMARGVDAAAHRGALATGSTVAVWGTGCDRVYPPEHAGLAEEIASHGALITEYPPGTAPLPQHFPERNRILATLARVVVVVEANEKSGALITARLALDEGRDVMAVPGSIFSRLSTGPNGLLRSGAAPVVTAADVLQAVGLTAAVAEAKAENGLLALIPHGEAVSIDHLAAAAGRPIGHVLEELFNLELAGRIRREPDGRIRRAGDRK